MKLSRTVSYALQATLQLARSKPGQPVPCSRLAAEGHMPERFLLQILRNLVTHGILQSTRGVDGGYMLDRDPADISLLEIFEAIDGPMIAHMPIANSLPDGSHEKLQSALQEIASISRQQLAAIKLTHLLSPPDNN